MWNFTLEEPPLVDKFGGCNEASLDQRPIHYAGRYRQQLDLASQNVTLYTENKEWFREQASIMVELVKAIDDRIESDHLKMLTKYAHLYTPDVSGPAADANRIQRMLIDNPTVQLESVLGRRCISRHRMHQTLQSQC
jgi:hypothetical protein